MRGRQTNSLTLNMKDKQEFVYKVHINATHQEEFFTSVAAIYDTFTMAEVGIPLRKLWAITITPRSPFSNAYCTISKHLLRRKKHLRLPEWKE